MNTTYGTMINARDFSSRITDPNRETWTKATLEHVVAALDGKRIALVADSSTGHTLINVALGEFRPTPGFGGHQVQVIDTYTEGGKEIVRATWHNVFKLGAILPLEEGFTRNAKWTALETYRAARAAAVTA